MDAIRFLIIIPYFNRPEIVKNALQSITEIEYHDFEVSFLDDGSEVAGKPIVEQIFPEGLLRRTSFYRCEDTVEEKIKQGGSRQGYYHNQAILNSSAEYFIVVNDDDAVMPDFFAQLNVFLQGNKLPYCYSRVRFYSPDVETYKEHRENAQRNFAGSTYALNYNVPLRPSCVIDNSQMICNTKCFKDGLVAYPYPKTACLDAVVYNSLYNLYGACHPTGLFGQIKGAWQGQLGNSPVNY